MALPRRTPEPDDPGFQLTPMIDMTFLLLIFFMVTTKMSKEQVKMEVRLPTATAAVIPEDLSQRDTINIDAAGQFHIANDLVSRDQLASHLKRRFANAPPLKIYLRADRDTPAQTIRDFMKLAADAGAITVIFASHPR
ncbi:MAG: ExbD/TolR family protein [Verrucomicrobiales bacterium]